MSAKPVVLRRTAEDDIRSATDYLNDEGTPELARRFLVALELAFSSISEQPTSGSPRFAHELDLPGVRSWLLADSPYLIFYVELDDHVQVWRVLHVKRDLGFLLGADQP